LAYATSSAQAACTAAVAEAIPSGGAGGADIDAAAAAADDDDADDDDADADEAEDNFWADSPLLRDAVPNLAASAFELLGTAARDLPLPVLRAAVEGSGLPHWARAACVRLSNRVEAGAVHNYYFFLSVAAAGRLPPLTAAIRDAFCAERAPGATRWRFAWLEEARIHFADAAVDGPAKLQAALALVRVLTAACMSHTAGVLADADDAWSEAGFAGRVVHRSGGRGGGFPRPLAEGADVRVPDWLWELHDPDMDPPEAEEEEDGPRRADGSRAAYAYSRAYAEEDAGVANVFFFSARDEGGWPPPAERGEADFGARVPAPWIERALRSGVATGVPPVSRWRDTAEGLANW
jgi:hypothetical protein